MARVVFLGRMLPGTATSLDRRRVLGSPATMRMLGYLKGTGPQTVRVRTGATITANGVTVAEDGIEPQVGEIWKIYTGSRHQPYDTSICGGSTRMTSAARVAVDLWSAFPVRHVPRPVLLAGDGYVLAPSTGFPGDAAGIAFDEGRFTLGASLPGSSGAAGHDHMLSARAAYRVLHNAGRSSAIKVPPLVIRSVRLGVATFSTDRGRRRLPAWQFWFRGVAKPASVLALLPPAIFNAPPLEELGPPGDSIDAPARVDRAGTAITISFIGAPPGTGACDARYLASAIADRHAVAFTINTISTPSPRAMSCPAVGYHRSVVLRLASPLGKRVLVSSNDAGAVPVTSEHRPPHGA